MTAQSGCDFAARLLELPELRAAETGQDFPLVWAMAACYGADGLGEQIRVTTSFGNQSDDAALVQATADGDKTALQNLYDRHGGVLFGLALKILNDRSDAEDVLQEVFVQIWKTANSFDQRRGKPLGWFIMLTRSRAIDRLRSRNTRTRVMEAVSQEVTDETPLPAQEADVAETRTLVRHAMQALPAEQRQLIELAYFGGLSQSEIAGQLGQPLGTVKTRMRTGLLRLREQLVAAGGAS